MLKLILVLHHILTLVSNSSFSICSSLMNVGSVKFPLVVFCGKLFSVNVNVCCHFAAVLCGLDTILLFEGLCDWLSVFVRYYSSLMNSCHTLCTYSYSHSSLFFLNHQKIGLIRLDTPAKLAFWKSDKLLVLNTVKQNFYYETTDIEKISERELQSFFCCFFQCSLDKYVLIMDVHIILSKMFSYFLYVWAMKFNYARAHLNELAIIYDVTLFQTRINFFHGMHNIYN